MLETMLMLDLLSVCEGDDMKRDIAYYMALPYREIIEADAAGGYVGYVAELKGCITQAETKAELLDLLEDAKRCWLEAALEEGADYTEAAVGRKFQRKIQSAPAQKPASRAGAQRQSGGGQSESACRMFDCKRAEDLCCEMIFGRETLLCGSFFLFEDVP